MSGNIDIEAIMDEIREEAKKNSAKGIVPVFEDVPITPAAPKNWDVVCAYPAEGNPLKKLYSRIVSKLVRCALFPLTERLTAVHREMQQQMETMNAAMAEQAKEIEELHKRLDQAEKGNR